MSREKWETFLAWCQEVTRQRVESIMSNQHRGSYGKAAQLTVAVAETLCVRGDAGRTRFPRHSAFQAELRSAVALMEQSKRDFSHSANMPPTLC